MGFDISRFSLLFGLSATIVTVAGHIVLGIFFWILVAIDVALDSWKYMKSTKSESVERP